MTTAHQPDAAGVPAHAPAAPHAAPHGHGSRLRLGIVGALVGGVGVATLVAGTHAPGETPRLLGVGVEFFAFGFTLLSVALFHHATLQVALGGLSTVLALKLGFDGAFDVGHHLAHEAKDLLNLLGLLLGFALLAKHFEHSRAHELLPRWLPAGVAGAFSLLAVVFVLSSFLDNIAGAMIGGTIAMHVFRGRVHIGYLAAIVAASNAGGAPSVVGDTTTTMMWLRGVSPLEVVESAVGAVVALFVFGLFAARQQHKLQPLVKGDAAGVTVGRAPLVVVALVLAGAIAGNIWFGLPAVGAWVVLLGAAPFVRTDWAELPAALKGAVFLLSLVLCASMMPVKELPPPSPETAFGLGFLSSVFDNIPLTKLALDQNGYDWGFLSFAVGFGGSMVWFGSSAGVALSNMFPQARSVGLWLRHGWHVALAYVLGFGAMLLVLGWHPHNIPRQGGGGHDHDHAPVHAPAH